MINKGSDELLLQLRITLGNMELALGTIKEAIVWTDLSGNIVWCNKTFNYLVSLEHIDILGKQLTKILPFKMEGLFFEVKENEADVAERRCEYIKGHERIVLNVYVKYLNLPYQKLFIIVFHDITKETQYLEDLEKKEERLSVLNKELEAFSYSVSHDLRAPLRAVDGFSQALLEGYDKKLDEQGKYYLHNIRKSALRMGELIEDILHLSEISHCEISLDRVNLTELCRSISKDLLQSDGTRNVEFKIEDPLSLEGDSHLIRIMMENILNNAFKFTSHNPKAEIHVGKKVINGAVTFYIRDNGIGFDMAHADLLFAPWRRLHSGSEFPGTGIGLATVQRIIQRHGGKIWAEGEVGKGATFYFYLTPPSNGSKSL